MSQPTRQARAGMRTSMLCSLLIPLVMLLVSGCATYRSRGKGAGQTEESALTIIRSVLTREITERGPGDLHPTVILKELTTTGLTGEICPPARSDGGAATSEPYHGSSGALQALDPLNDDPTGTFHKGIGPSGVPFSIRFARVDDVYVNSERHIYRTAGVVVHERDGIETEFPVETIAEAQDLADAIAYLRDQARKPSSK